MRENGIIPKVIKAGKTNLFLSKLFTESFVNITGIPVELYNNDGSVGAALGAGIGAGIFSSATEAFNNTKAVELIEPSHQNLESAYKSWKNALKNQLATN